MDGSLSLWKRNREMQIDEEGLGEPSEADYRGSWPDTVSNIVNAEV